MHAAVRKYVREHLPKHYASVLEVGSLDINGGVRDLLDPAARYTGVDAQRGPGVDVVADFATYRHSEPVDLILCLEVLEHAHNWREILRSAHENLKPGGTLIVTCATEGRPPHSGRVEAPPQPDEHYANVTQRDFDDAIADIFAAWDSEVRGFDLRAFAVRASEPLGIYSVIIPSNDPEKVRTCVASLRKSQPDIDASQIVIVADGLHESLRDELGGVVWVEGKRPFVFPRAVNMGVAASHAACDIVVLGDDVRINTPRAIEKLGVAARDGAAAAAQVIGVCGQSAQSATSRATDAEWLAFICIYIPRAVWDAVGPLDERFVGYGYDDVDWCARAKYLGPLIVAHDVTVTHRSNSAYRSQPHWRDLYAQNRALFEDKWRQQRGGQL